MSTFKMTGFVAAVFSLGLVACVDSGDADKGEEEEVPADGKLDSFAHPIEHGVLPFGGAAESALTAAEHYHTWTFSLVGPARVHAYTGPSITGRQIVDTVLYLYKQKANGTWGAYIARNDDFDGNLFSSLTKNLDAGNYRMLVKGYAASTRGRYSAHVECEGAGCEAEPVQECVFGSQFRDILYMETPAPIDISLDRHLHADVCATASALDKQRFIVALQQSSHTDVTTCEQAFAAADQGDIRRIDLYDPTGARAFVALEYGAGDNSYGAFFGYNSAAVLTNIHDGDLENCATYPQTCALGGDWYTTRNSGAFTTTSTRVITAASQLTGVDATNALAAIRVAYAESTSLADGLTRVDGDQLNVVDLTHTATGTMVRAYEYGAGDNSYGAIYRAGTAEQLSTIVDLTYYDCTFAE